jgi:hypothetical protein
MDMPTGYRVFVYLRGRWVPTGDTATSREALEEAVSKWQALYPPRHVIIEADPPHVLDGLAHDFMRDNPLLSYEKARELAETC